MDALTPIPKISTREQVQLSIGRHFRSAFRPVFLLTCAVVLPLLMFVGVLATNSLQRQQDSTKLEALETVRDLSVQIDAELARHIDLVRILAAMPAFDVGADPKLAHQVLWRAVVHQPLWGAAHVATPDGMIVVTASNGAPQLVNDRASFDTMIATGTPIIGNIIRSSDGQFGVPIHAPIVRDGTVLGALSIVIRTKSIHDFLVQAELPDGWRAVVIDAAGRRVARNTLDEEVRGTPALPATLAARKRGLEGVAYDAVLVEGGPAIAFYRQSSATNWSVHIAIPRADYDAPLNRLRWLIAGQSMAAVLLAFAFAVMLARELSARRTAAAERQSAERMEALGRMTGRIAHDFNNLLAVISSASQNMRRRVATPEAERYAGLIGQAVDRGVAITGELLLFARAGMVPLKPADINTRIRHTMGLVREAVGSDVDIEVDLAETLPRVMIDPVQFDLALLNLAVNAREAMSGAGQLAIATKAGILDADRRRCVALTVSDTGAGVPAHQLPHVFEPFFTTREVAKGPGLGLAQVYAFAKLCGGSVRMESEVGVGSTVIMLLPEAEESTPDVGGALPSPGAWTGKRLLLVDDDEGVRSITADSLMTLGFEVVEAEDAKTALGYLDTATFDLLISDIMMPGGMDGVGLARQARARWPKMPTLLISGYSPSVQQAMTSGWPVIAKPFTIETLSEQIAEKIGTA